MPEVFGCIANPRVDIGEWSRPADGTWRTMSETIEERFGRARFGDRDAFAEWMGAVELPLRRSLARFAHVVDVEVVAQETLMRMWLVACDAARILEGENASLRFALRVARNVALEELRRTHHEESVDPDDLDKLSKGFINPDLPDPALRKAITECIERLPKQPQKALTARINEGHLPDHDLARKARMKLNTFLQNIVRARRLFADCLEKRGVRLQELLP